MTIGSVLTVIFVALKAAEVSAVAAWPWLWCFAPILLELTVVAVMFLLGLLAVGVLLWRSK